MMREVERRGFTLGGGTPAAHDGQLRLLERVETTGHIHGQRRVGKDVQQMRIAIMGERH